MLKMYETGLVCLFPSCCSLSREGQRNLLLLVTRIVQSIPPHDRQRAPPRMVGTWRTMRGSWRRRRRGPSPSLFHGRAPSQPHQSPASPKPNPSSIHGAWATRQIANMLPRLAAPSPLLSSPSPPRRSGQVKQPAAAGIQFI